MLSSNNEVNIQELSDLTSIENKYWSVRIYSLIGDGKLSGEFDGKVFHGSADTDIDQLIDGLFEEFTTAEKTKIGKIE